jgi:hypothetical protein
VQFILSQVIKLTRGLDIQVPLIMLPTFLSCFLLLILGALPFSEALVNITIDDQDPRISYVPPSSWFLDEGINSDYGGSHMRTEDPDAYATVTLKCALNFSVRFD